MINPLIFVFALAGAGLLLVDPDRAAEGIGRTLGIAVVAMQKLSKS